jgi:hypothetical protein
MAIALLSGVFTLRQARLMMHDSVSIEDGGGWTAIFLSTFTLHFAALAYLLSY